MDKNLRIAVIASVLDLLERAHFDGISSPCLHVSISFTRIVKEPEEIETRVYSQELVEDDAGVFQPQPIEDRIVS